MYCYGTGAGYGRFIDRVEQPLASCEADAPCARRKRGGANCRHVRCVETGEVFEKVSDIGKLCPSYDLEKLVPCILNAMRNGNRSLGHRWARVADEQYTEYLKHNERLSEALRDDAGSELHGTVAAARLPEGMRCGCEKCRQARTEFEALRSLDMRLVKSR